jgi:hypothetical protein
MLEAPGLNPPEKFRNVQPADLKHGNIIWIRRDKPHAVDGNDMGNVRGIRDGYYECEVQDDAGQLVAVNQEPIPSFPPGYGLRLIPAGTKIPIGGLDPGNCYQEVA